jgi:hypothetical protein
MFDAVIELVHHLAPLARLAVAILFPLTIPPLCWQVRLPDVVGLLMAGVLLGPYGFGIAPKNAEVAHFFAEIGKLLLTFFAGMAIDLVQFNRTRNRSLGFGLLTFTFPLLARMFVGFCAGYPWVGAILIGSLLASHTLIAFPIVAEHGTISPSRLTWNDAIVVRLAQAAYDKRQLPAGTLDTSRLAVLADALEEAGCAGDDILSHLRGPEPHVRGCWVVDLLLAKE